MPSAKAHIVVSGNNPKLISAVTSYSKNPNVKYSKNSFLEHSTYYLVLIHLQSNLETVSQELISLYSKCRENNSKILVCLLFDGDIKKDNITHFQNLLNDLGKEKLLHRLVITKDLYSTNYPQATTILDEEIIKILEGNSINISEKGNNYLYPLHINDFIEAITKILFLNSTSGKTLYILGDSVKDLDLAYIVKKIVVDEKPNYQINSNAKNNPRDPEIENLSDSTQANINWSPINEFEISLKNIYQQIKTKPQDIIKYDHPSTDNKILRIGESLIEKIKRYKYKFIQNPNREDTYQNKYRKTLGRIVIISAVTYLVICAIFGFSIYQSYKTLASSLNYLRKGDIQNSVFYVRKTVFYDQIAINIYWPIRPVVKLLSEDYDEKLHNLFSFNQYLESSLENLQQSYVLSEKIYMSFVDDSKNNNINDKTLALKSSLGQIYDNLNQIDIMVNSGKLPKELTSKIKDNPDFKQLGNLEIQLTQAIKLTNILPVIASNNASKKIAIIVQDQDELRSLGGIIRYLLLLNINNGKLTEVKIYNQTDIDSLNDGSIKAPEVVSRITGSDSWKFRDMTYVGDFSQTSQYISWFLEKTIQVQPDVFIAINKSLFEKLITKEGLNISGKTITAQSLKNNTVEVEQDTLRTVIDYYISEYRNQKLSLANLSKVVIDEVENSNIYFWARDSIVENTLLSLPFSGVINPFNCHSALANYETCINQTTFITESNFTIFPVNQSLNRELVHVVNLTQNESIHEYQLKYHFTNDLSSLNRDYRLIYQLYVPAGSNLLSVTIDDQELQSSTFVKQKFNQFDYYQIPVALSTNQDHQVKIKFKLGIIMSSDINQTAYSITEIRQSGVKDNGYGLIINLPENTHSTLVTSPVDTKPQQIYYRFPTKTATFGAGFALNRL